MHLALQVSWIMQAYIEDDNEQTRKRCNRLREDVEIAIVNFKRPHLDKHLSYAPFIAASNDSLQVSAGKSANADPSQPALSLSPSQSFLSPPQSSLSLPQSSLSPSQSSLSPPQSSLSNKSNTSTEKNISSSSDDADSLLSGSGGLRAMSAVGSSKIGFTEPTTLSNAAVGATGTTTITPTITTTMTPTITTTTVTTAEETSSNPHSSNSSLRNSGEDVVGILPPSSLKEESGEVEMSVSEENLRFALSKRERSVYFNQICQLLESLKLISSLLRNFPREKRRNLHLFLHLSFSIFLSSSFISFLFISSFISFFFPFSI